MRAKRDGGDEENLGEQECRVPRFGSGQRGTPGRIIEDPIGLRGKHGEHAAGHEDPEKVGDDTSDRQT